MKYFNDKQTCVQNNRSKEECKKELKNLKNSLYVYYNHDVSKLTYNNLLSNGFRPKVIYTVLAKLKKYGRPIHHYSKITGKLKKNV